jgi:hypothetical protein
MGSVGYLTAKNGGFWPGQFRFATCLTQWIEATGDPRAVAALWRFAPKLSAQMNKTKLGYTDWSAARAQEMVGAYQWLLDNHGRNASAQQVQDAVGLMGLLTEQGYDWPTWILGSQAGLRRAL